MIAPPRGISFIQQINVLRIILCSGDTEVNVICPCEACIPLSILALTQSELGNHWKVLSRGVT